MCLKCVLSCSGSDTRDGHTLTKQPQCSAEVEGMLGLFKYWLLTLQGKRLGEIPHQQLFWLFCLATNLKVG